MLPVHSTRSGHAIFEQIPGLYDELRFRMGFGLAQGNISDQQKALHPVMLNWLDEIIADIAGTALAGAEFAKGAILTLTLPEKFVDDTDAVHPPPLVRPYTDARILQNIPSYSSSTPEILSILDNFTSRYLGRRFESLPSIISLTLGDVRLELERLVDLIWNTPLDTLG